MAMKISTKDGRLKATETAQTEHWATALEKYEDRLNGFAEREKKREETMEKLKSYDRWLRVDLSQTLAKRRHITSKDLTKLTEWKMLRGQWRPRNLQLVQSNDEKVVENASKEAFDHYDRDDIKGAIKSLSELKGVGPATASAILSAYGATRGGKAPFMSDEALLACGFELKYTPAAYLKFYTEVKRLAAEISENDRECTPHQLEQAIWSFSESLAGGKGAKEEKKERKTKKVQTTDEKHEEGGVKRKAEKEVEEPAQKRQRRVSVPE